MKLKLLCLILYILFLPSFCSAYGITALLEDSGYEQKTGYKLYYGTVKGGPYPNFINCGKPPLLVTGDFECKVSEGITPRRIFVVAVGIDTEGETPYSNEYEYSIPRTNPRIKQILQLVGDR